MPKAPLVLLGKTIRHLSRIRGGGSALPGLIVEKIDSSFLARSLAHLPYGVVIISGTNGKTTTTKMVVELLQSQGLRVLTNATGSNFSRGVVSSVIEKSTIRGKLHDDIAVLELDEAHAVHFVKEIPPAYCLLLNVMRDQLDRFGEIDTTAQMLSVIAQATTKKVVINREDSRLVSISKNLPSQKTIFFGLDRSLKALFPSDDELYDSTSTQKKTTDQINASVLLKSMDTSGATFIMNESSYHTPLMLKGVYNVFNAAGAIALVQAILDTQFDVQKLLDSLSKITPAFGRGETVMIDNQPVEIILVKNPNGFRLGLTSFAAKDVATMIAINDDYADGRDMSWLWDVPFDSLKDGVRMLSGTRAHDMALRLTYDEITYDFIKPDLAHALDIFIHETTRPKQIYCTYTAMLAIRKELAKLTKMERVL